jgi:hypothetical protein
MTILSRTPLIGALTVAAILGCGSGGDATSPSGGGPTTAALPAELIARWHLEQAGDPTCDPSTGQCITSFARSETLELTSTGTFEHSLFAESNLPPCSLTAHHQSSGTAEADGATLQLHVQKGVTSVQDNCGESGDTDESGKTYHYSYRITSGSAGGRQLTLTDEQGDEIGPFDQQ